VRVLFCVNPGRGHLHPVVPLAWALRTAGHDVRVAAAPAAVAAVAAAGLIAVPVGPDVRLSRVSRARPGVPGTVGEEARKRMAATGGRFARLAEAGLDDLVAFGRAWRPDLVVHEPTAVAGPLVGAVLGVPAVWHRWGVDIAWPVVEAATEHLRPLYARFGLTYDGPAPDLVLDPCPPGLQLDGLPAATRVRYLPYDGGGALPPDLPDGPAGLVTLGTMADETGLLAIRRIAAAMAGLGVTPLVAVPPDQVAALGDLPGARPVVSVPLHLLLERVVVAVNHGGSNSAMNGVNRGLPQLVVPHLPDGQVTADQLARAGAGVHLPMSEATPDAVTTALTDLLSDDSFAAAAGKLRDEMHALPMPAAVVPRLAEVAGCG
jgi:UDP:flavonoid glycosyltransferase YjiC (YdhE family)